MSLDRTKMSLHFMEQILSGNVKALRGKSLVVRRVSTNTFEIQVLDEKNIVLVSSPRATLEVGDSMTVTGLDMMFDVKLIA